MSLPNFEWFHLDHHGNRYEREWWHLLSETFPAYEIFWQRHVIPLTNRLRMHLNDENADEWIRLTSDSRELEDLARTNFSVFYYTARATLAIRAGGPVYFYEDAFHLLDLVGRNLQERGLRGDPDTGFIPCINELAKNLGQPPIFPKFRITATKPFNEIRKYRNVFEHYPVLGRPEKLAQVWLPRFELLKNVKGAGAWHIMEPELTRDNLVHGRELLQGYLDKALDFLNKTWEKVIIVLEDHRNDRRYLELQGNPESRADCLEKLSSPVPRILR